MTAAAGDMNGTAQPAPVSFGRGRQFDADRGTRAGGRDATGSAAGARTPPPPSKYRRPSFWAAFVVLREPPVKGTLLLNASFEPLCVVPMKRAVVLVLAEKAEILEAACGVIRSASTAVPVPSVIRLTTYVRVPYRARLPLTRRALLARDGHRCAYCGRSADTIDHVVPRSRSGRHEWENVVAACRLCNGRKGDRLLNELGWVLHTTPTVPRGTRWLVVGVGRIDPSWEPYLTQAA